jgi:hypothetical protein
MGIRQTRIVAATIVFTALVSACNYSHSGPAAATFSRPAPPSLGAGSLETQIAPLVLRISRHLDTVLRGPDNEEDQVLVLEVRDFQINQRLAIPSDNVTADFIATRFGPSSKGQGYVGYLIVKKVTPNKVEAYLHLDVTASTASGSYTQTARFRGDFPFILRHEEAPAP